MSGTTLQKAAFRYDGKVTPKKFKHLDPGSFDLEFGVTVELDANDASKQDKIFKEFLKKMKEQVDDQLDHLNERLSEWNDVIDDFVKEGEALKGFPESAKELSAFDPGKIEKLKKINEKIELYKTDFQTICENWATNCANQQGLIAINEAIKSVNKKAVAAKNFRVNLGKAIKVTLVILGVAVAIAAIVVSAGSTAPLFIGLAAAGAAVATGGNITGLAKWLSDKGSNETRTYNALMKDLESLKGLLDGGPSKCDTISKHVTELQTGMKERTTRINEFKQEIAKKKGEASGYKRTLDELLKATDQNEIKSVASKKQASIDKVMQDIDKLEKKIKELEGHNTDSQKLLLDLEAYGVDLRKLSGHSPSTLIGNIKAKMSTPEGWADVLSTTGSLVNSAAGIHK